MKSVAVQIAKAIRVSSRFQGKEILREFHKPSVVVGRLLNDERPDLDLHPDTNVSRRHARLWIKDDAFWIEDSGSRFGTFVNDERLRAGDKRHLLPGDVIRVGDTELRVAVPVNAVESYPELPTGAVNASDPVSVTVTLSGNASLLTQDTGLIERQARLLELPLEFGSTRRLEDLLQSAMQRVIEVLPGAQRGALLLRSGENNALLLAAFVSEGDPPVSETLARRAVTQAQAFIWRRSCATDEAASIKRLNIHSGMYAPLIWSNKVLGVVCVDNTESDSTFSERDLRLLLAVAHYTALFVANHQLQNELRTNAKVLERLLTNFSPKIRQTLLDKARRGLLRPGGEESEVTILFSDIRGFTGLSAEMEPGEVVAMLNEYFPALAEAIFAHDGTIDKFVGDAIVAVFGSPEPDEHQHSKAVHAALAMQSAMRVLNLKRAERGEVVCEIGIGLHCGRVLHGFIGFHERLEYTVIGDAVNRTSRYCDAAKSGEVLASPELHQRVFKIAQWDRTCITTKHDENLPAFRLRTH